jgi:hypothetical protein
MSSMVSGREPHSKASLNRLQENFASAQFKKKCVLCFLFLHTVYTLKGQTSFSFLAVRQIVFCHCIFAKEIFLSSKVGSLSIYSSSIYSLLQGRIAPCIAKLWKIVHSSAFQWRLASNSI